MIAELLGLIKCNLIILIAFVGLGCSQSNSGEFIVVASPREVKSGDGFNLVVYYRGEKDMRPKIDFDKLNKIGGVSIVSMIDDGDVMSNCFWIVPRGGGRFEISENNIFLDDGKMIHFDKIMIEVSGG